MGILQLCVFRPSSVPLKGAGSLSELRMCLLGLFGVADFRLVVIPRAGAETGTLSRKNQSPSRGPKTADSKNDAEGGVGLDTGRFVIPSCEESAHLDSQLFAQIPRDGTADQLDRGLYIVDEHNAFVFQSLGALTNVSFIRTYMMGKIVVNTCVVEYRRSRLSLITVSAGSVNRKPSYADAMTSETSATSIEGEMSAWISNVSDEMIRLRNQYGEEIPVLVVLAGMWYPDVVLTAASDMASAGLSLIDAPQFGGGADRGYVYFFVSKPLTVWRRAGSVVTSRYLPGIGDDMAMSPSGLEIANVRTDFMVDPAGGSWMNANRTFSGGDYSKEYTDQVPCGRYPWRKVQPCTDET
jgi:hypothetical protein